MVEALRRLASRRMEGLEELSDPEIVALCKKELPSDLTAYRELLRRYEGLVYNTCAKYIGSVVGSVTTKLTTKDGGFIMVPNDDLLSTTTRGHSAE